MAVETEVRENRSGMPPALVRPTPEASDAQFDVVGRLGSVGGGGSAHRLGPERVLCRGISRVASRCHKGVSANRYIWAIGVISYNVTRVKLVSIYAPASPWLWGERGGDRHELQGPRNRLWGREWGYACRFASGRENHFSRGACHPLKP